MRKAKLVTPPVTPASLLSLLGLPDGQRGCKEVLLQAPSTNTLNINFGTAEAQPASIAPGGSATLENITLSTTYVKGDGSDTLAVLVLR